MLAHTPSPVRPRLRRSNPRSGGSTYPDTRLLPLETTSPRGTGPDVFPAGEYAWAEPEVLLERLDELAAERATGEWATEAAGLVRKLGPAVWQGSDEAISIVRRLQQLASQATPLSATVGDRPLARKLCRAGHALGRRLDVWEQIVQLGSRGAITAEVFQPDPRQLSLCLVEIDAITGDSAQGRAWREYLLLDALREWSARGGPPQDRLPRRLAQRVLKRLTRDPMSPQQRQFVSSSPVAALQAELQRWAGEPVGLAELSEHLERYEKAGLASDARLLATDCLHLGLLSGAERRRLAERLEANYRNANLRVAVTEELLDRLMPEKEPKHALVRDTVLGKPVKGRSLTSSKVGVRLLPDPNRVRLALEITGQVASRTSSTTGPATFYNDSTSTYTALKPLEVDLEGIRSLPAEVAVRGETRLRKLRTDFDGIPLVGELVKGIARSQHAQKHAAASRELRQKVALRSRRQIDSDAEARLSQASERLRQRILDPLETMRLDPTIIDAETTDRRLTIRLRLAGEDQLGGHTPRPRAPSGSLASLQVHETAMNNALEGLALGGRTFTLPELSDHVATRLSRPPFWEIDPEHEDVRITFAKQDPVRVRLREGRVLLSLSIAKLSNSRQRWRDFTVRVFYRPRVHGRSARLARDGIVHLDGRGIGTGAQIALRGIFNKTFSKRRSWKLTPERLTTEEKLADLAVTQFVIEDGWIGVALGPQRTALRPVLPRR